MKLLGSTENEITKDKNGENVRHLEIAELQIQEYYIRLFAINRLVAY